MIKKIIIGLYKNIFCEKVLKAAKVTLQKDTKGIEYFRSKTLKGLKLLLEGIQGIEGTEVTESRNGKKFICKLVGKAFEEVEGLKAEGLETEPVK